MTGGDLKLARQVILGTGHFLVPRVRTLQASEEQSTWGDRSHWLRKESINTT